MRIYWTLHQVDYSERTVCGRSSRRMDIGWRTGGYLVYDLKCPVCFPT